MAVKHYIWAHTDGQQLKRVLAQFKDSLARNPQGGVEGFLLTFNSQEAAEGAAGWLGKINVKYEGPTSVIPDGYESITSAAARGIVDDLTSNTNTKPWRNWPS